MTQDSVKTYSVEELLDRIGDLEEKIERLESQNDPQWDATDVAHPAWWRAEKYVSELWKSQNARLSLERDRWKTEAETYRLAITECISLANGREEDWGMRAVNSFGFLHRAIETYPELGRLYLEPSSKPETDQP